MGMEAGACAPVLFCARKLLTFNSFGDTIRTVAVKMHTGTIVDSKEEKNATQKTRAKTFPGIAKAMADQWG